MKTCTTLFTDRLMRMNISLDLLNNSSFCDIINTGILWRCKLAVCYDRLFHLLIDKRISNAQLKEKAGFSANIITRLKRNEYISMETVERICTVLMIFWNFQAKQPAMSPQWKSNEGGCYE